MSHDFCSFSDLLRNSEASAMTTSVSSCGTPIISRFASTRPHILRHLSTNMANKISQLKGRYARLASSHYFAGAAYLQILFRDAKPVVGFTHYAEPLACDAGLFVARQ